MQKYCIRIMPSTKTQCHECKGIGFIKTDYVICSICHGIKCMSCNSIGLEVLPWSNCNVCDRLGEITPSHI